jgi:hypothetical protein
MCTEDPAVGGRREIGGYFGLELDRRGDNPHAAARALNSARNCLLYFLLARRPAKLFLPAYLCDSMSEPLRQTGTAHEFYNIDADLEVACLPALGRDEFLLYVNYFGLKEAYCRRLAAHCGPALIVDNSQAMFSAPLPCAATLYSPRKFVGVADGGYLYSEAVLDQAPDRDVSWDSVQHLVGRIDLDAAAFYRDYLSAGQRLSGRPLRRMSALTEAMLDSVDYGRARLTRQRNFLYLHAALGSSNRLRIDTMGIDGPMVYPYWTDDPDLRQRLIARKVYVATYWSEVLRRDAASSAEKQLVTHLVPLPIDQRYGLDDMRFVLDAVGR